MPSPMDYLSALLGLDRGGGYGDDYGGGYGGGLYQQYGGRYQETPGFGDQYAPPPEPWGYERAMGLGIQDLSASGQLYGDIAPQVPSWQPAPVAQPDFWYQFNQPTYGGGGWQGNQYPMVQEWGNYMDQPGWMYQMPGLLDPSFHQDWGGWMQPYSPAWDWQNPRGTW